MNRHAEALRAIAASDAGQSDDAGGSGWRAAHDKLASYARAALANPPTVPEAAADLLAAMERELDKLQPEQAAWMRRNMGVIRKML